MTNTKPTAISAGGIIVKKDENFYYILLLRDTRYPEWFLPKGHVEKTETLEQAALREIKEEAGLSKIKIGPLLGTYERFVSKADEFKKINYFLAFITAEEIPSPPENKFVEIKWFKIDKLPIMYLPEQQDVIEKNINLIKENL
jgi:8-oxo-dGTP pyrophosphatase MutT (NUDIX family)